MNTTPRSRQPKGQPIGGQFAPESRSESAVSLAPAVTARDTRRAALARGGYVSPIAGAALDDPGRADGAADWWDS